MKIQSERVTRMTASAVKEEVLRAVEGGDGVLDFAAVKTVDSSAVSLVLSFMRRCEEKRLAPRVVNVPEKLVSLAKLYGIDDLVLPRLAAGN